MITQYFVPQLRSINIVETLVLAGHSNMPYRVDTINLLKESFDKRLISRNGSVNWLPRSCNLTPLNCFL